jgi:hypothetical protein
MKRGPAYSYRKNVPQNVWTRYDAPYNGTHGMTISGAGARYQVRIHDNPWFVPPEVIGKRICWIASQINPNGALLYRMSYGSLP